MTALDARDRVELVTFARTALAWRYTSADRAITHESLTYQPVAGLSRSRIENGGEVGKSSLTFTVPLDLPIVQDWIRQPPGEEITVVLRELPADRVSWLGLVDDIRRERHLAKIVCQSEVEGMQRQGLLRTWQRGCPYTLGDALCTVNLEAWKTPATLTLASGFVVEAAEFAAKPDGFFVGGFLAWEIAPGVFERRYVEAHTGARLTLMGVAPGLAVGHVAAAYPGCGGTTALCHGRFGNVVNYGGQPYFPDRTPFEGGPVY